MQRDCQQLREDAFSIWRAGVEAVQPENLLPQHVAVEGNILHLGDDLFELDSIRRIVVVGAGKAGASMVLALESILGPKLLADKQVTGWVNVPADCVCETQRITLHPARPPGVNEPTEAGVVGTAKILEQLQSLDEQDLCLCLISGGGSALLPAPVEGFSLEDKVALTRQLSAAGATIEQLNTVRRELSRVKGGRLARACRADHLVALILSDVLGDDLETIASGPTVLRQPTPDAALKVFDQLQLESNPSLDSARRILQQLRKEELDENPLACKVTNRVIGNNATAVDAAGTRAEKLGYSHAMTSANTSEPQAEQVARELVRVARSMRESREPDCLISGGEPTVKLAPAEKRGLGGRNQQLVLAALMELDDWQNLALLSGGTDGEDGPTDAAGAIVNQQVVEAAKEKGIDPRPYLARNDAYHFFEQVDGLIKTGPTQTNVCDLRVITVSR